MHAPFNDMKVNILPHPFCSHNQLGAAGAEELVKGDWPELCLLNIRLIGLLSSSLRSSLLDGMACPVDVQQITVDAGRMRLVQKEWATSQVDCG
jgi:hypothetical protein